MDTHDVIPATGMRHNGNPSVATLNKIAQGLGHELQISFV